MLSILIPVYRYDAGPLIRQLLSECRQLRVAWEIIVLDDASGSEWQPVYRDLREYPGVQWIEAPANLGRAKARNQLAGLAQYDWLLFFDCDVLPEHDDFLQQYVHAMQHTGADVIVGGRSYAPERPRLPFVLHWTYGCAREVRPASERALTPYRSFMTNNFAVRRSCVLAIGFEERLRQYGHEDTLFGQELERREYSILHIDNPMRHIGLDPDSDFIAKAKAALDNLVLLHAMGRKLPVRLLDAALRIEGAGLGGLVLFLSAPWVRIWRKSLLCRRPKLYIFDAYRLVFCLRRLRALKKKGA